MKEILNAFALAGKEIKEALVASARAVKVFLAYYLDRVYEIVRSSFILIQKLMNSLIAGIKDVIIKAKELAVKAYQFILKYYKLLAEHYNLVLHAISYVAILILFLR